MAAVAEAQLRSDVRRCSSWVLALGMGLVASAGPPPAFAQATSAAATRVDGVAASIGGSAGEIGQVILRSDVELRARMLLLGRDRDQALRGDLPQGLLAAALRELIGEKLIAREAERVQITRPTQAATQAEMQQMIAAAGGRDRVALLLTRLGASAAELDLVAERRALVGAFLRANLEGTTVISEREIEAQLAREPGRFTGQNPLRARNEVRAQLARQSLARNIERWVRVLRARVPVRIYAEYAAS